MERLIYNDLLKWKHNTHRKPLILNGARQVGKTWILKEFGRREYEKTAYINCERADQIEEVRDVGHGEDDGPDGAQNRSRHGDPLAGGLREHRLGRNARAVGLPCP